MIRVYVIDDDPGVVDGIYTVLQQEPDFQITGSGRCIQDVGRHPCHADLVLVSVHLQEDGARHILADLDVTSSVPRIVMTGVRCPEFDLLPFLDRGISGYVLSDSTPVELVNTLRMIHRGEVVLSPKLAATMMNRLALLSLAYHRTKPVDPETAVVNTLTIRECDVIELVGRGYSNQEIAVYLDIELGTVKNHVHNILRKLDVGSRRAAASLFSRVKKQPYYRSSMGAPTLINDVVGNSNDAPLPRDARRRRLRA